MKLLCTMMRLFKDKERSCTCNKAGVGKYGHRLSQQQAISPAQEVV